MDFDPSSASSASSDADGSASSASSDAGETTTTARAPEHSRTRPDRGRRARVRGVTLKPSQLTAAQREAMWLLFSRYYTDVTRPAFLADLDEKAHVIVLVDPQTNAVRGFSTMCTFHATVDGRRIVALYSGDTIVDDTCWGGKTLHLGFMRYAMRLRLRYLHRPTYWFLLSKGYKTYLLLTRNFVDFWPRHDRPTPAWERALIDALARRRYPAAWRPDLGVLRFAAPQGRLRHNVAPIDATLLQDPDVRFFNARNPGHPNGDELCCIGTISLWLVPRFFLRWLSRLWRDLGGQRTSNRDAAAARGVG